MSAPQPPEPPDQPGPGTPPPPPPVDPAEQPPTVETPAADDTALRLHYAAISDVGRVRKDNQDSGYAGPWLIAVCDGVGGAARGDIASGTAISELRKLDEPPTDVDLIDRITVGMHDAHVEIGRLVDDDPALNGTSTTSTVALFDGSRAAIGHVGDSRAYLFRDGEISQLTTDHTFVQSLIDEGRITPEEARVHPHRNLILKALDGVHESEPDLFVLELVAGDRLLLCSDGACGVLDDGRLADILSMGTPDYAAVELVRASLEAGSSDNVTCLVADVVTAAQAAADPEQAALEPMLVGAAAELKRRLPRGLFRGHRSGDTGELDPVPDEIPEGVDFAIRADPIGDPEQARYAPRAPQRFGWLRRLLALAIVVGLVWIALAAAYSWSQRQYYIGVDADRVVIFRGVDVPGVPLSQVYRTTDLEVADLSDYDRDTVEDGLSVRDLESAERAVQRMAEESASSGSLSAPARPRSGQDGLAAWDLADAGARSGAPGADG